MVMAVESCMFIMFPSTLLLCMTDPSLDTSLQDPQQRGRPTSRFRFRAWQTNNHRDPSTFFKNNEITRCDLFPKLFFLSCQNPVTTLKIVYDNLSKRKLSSTLGDRQRPW